MYAAKSDLELETPAQLGFRMPAEWEPHAATWIAWPHNPHSKDWPGKFQPVPWVYAEIVRHLSNSERVCILVNDEAAQKRAREILRKCGIDLAQVEFHILPTNRVWLRDSGPIFVRNREGLLGAVDWHFNAWAKYPDWQLDDLVPEYVAGILHVPRWVPTIRWQGTVHKLVLEGGSIDVNGTGLLLTTEECLLSPVQQRNPGVSQEQLESALSQYFGIERFLWLNRGIAGDDTHGHVDDIARFVSSDTVLAAVEPYRQDENHLPLQENLERLRSINTPDGKPLHVVQLPMPAPVIFRGQRLPASYANFYIANSSVLVPTFNDPNDRKALNVIAELFPDRQVVGIYCGDLIWGLGAIHCLTQQQPR